MYRFGTREVRTELQKGYIIDSIENNNFVPSSYPKIKDVIEMCFTEFNWDNVIVAGGAVVSEILGIYINDIDIYLYGFETQEEYEKKIREICEKSNSVNFVRSKYCITLACEYFKIQIILCHHKFPREVVENFDIDACKCYYQNGEIYRTLDCIRAFRFRTITVDLTKKTSVLEYRLQKYRKKGFNLLIPNLDFDMVDKELLLKGEGLGYFFHPRDVQSTSNYEEESYGMLYLEDVFQLAAAYSKASIKWFIFNTDLDEIFKCHLLIEPFNDLKIAHKIETIPYFEDLGFKTTSLDLTNNSKKHMTDIQRNNWFCYSKESMIKKQIKELEDQLKSLSH